MIDSREQYDFVTIPYSIQVDGGIMPKRDMQGYGTWKVLRGEDDAFLYEAACERYKACGLDADSRTMERRLDPVGFRKACQCANDLHLLFMDSDVTPPEIVDSPSGTDLPWRRIHTVYSNADSFATGSKLMADAARRAFYDIGRMRMTANGSEVGEFVGREYSWLSLVKASGVTEDPAVESYTYLKRRVFAYGGTKSYSGESSISSGSYTATVHDYVETVIPYFYVYCQYSYLSVSENKFFLVKGDEVSASGGSVTFGTAAILSAAKKAYAAFGHDIDVSSLSTSGDSGFCSAMVSSPMLICKLGDHTDFSDIGWTYQP